MAESIEASSLYGGAPSFRFGFGVQFNGGDFLGTVYASYLMGCYGKHAQLFRLVRHNHMDRLTTHVSHCRTNKSPFIFIGSLLRQFIDFLVGLTPDRFFADALHMAICSVYQWSCNPQTCSAHNNFSRPIMIIRLAL